MARTGREVALRRAERRRIHHLPGALWVNSPIRCSVRPCHDPRPGSLALPFANCAHRYFGMVSAFHPDTRVIRVSPQRYQYSFLSLVKLSVDKYAGLAKAQLQPECG
jgi:hypothetical protein